MDAGGVIGVKRGGAFGVQRASSAWAKATGMARTVSRTSGAMAGTGAMPSSSVRI
jgi:hypothetical protein